MKVHRVALGSKPTDGSLNTTGLPPGVPRTRGGPDWSRCCDRLRRLNRWTIGRTCCGSLPAWSCSRESSHRPPATNTPGSPHVGGQ